MLDSYWFWKFSGRFPIRTPAATWRSIPRHAQAHEPCHSPGQAELFLRPSLFAFSHLLLLVGWRLICNNEIHSLFCNDTSSSFIGENCWVLYKLKKIFLDLCIWILCLFVYHMCAHCPESFQEVIKSPETRVMTFVYCHLGAGNWTYTQQ